MLQDSECPDSCELWSPELRWTALSSFGSGCLDICWFQIHWQNYNIQNLYSQGTPHGNPTFRLQRQLLSRRALCCEGQVHSSPQIHAQQFPSKAMSTSQPPRGSGSVVGGSVPPLARSQFFPAWVQGAKHLATNKSKMGPGSRKGHYRNRSKCW